MIVTAHSADPIDRLFSAKSVAEPLEKAGSVLIKVNLARAPEPNHPRTDSHLLKNLVAFLRGRGKAVGIAEAADGHLTENVAAIGLEDLCASRDVSWIDIDDVPYFTERVGSQAVLIPEFLLDYDLRIALPCASKRKGMLYSNNVKLFFGATPRAGYLRPAEGRWRSKLHDNLTQSVLNVYDAFSAHAPFHFYINGGNAASETIGEFYLDGMFLSSSAIELDTYIFNRFFSNDAKPEYLSILQNRLASARDVPQARPLQPGDLE